jgi:hypothetical protein
MNIRKAILAVSAAALIGPASFAATTKTEDCASLQKQVDAAIAANGNGPSIARAREHEAQGERLCREGKKSDGMKELHTAMKEAAAKAK